MREKLLIKIIGVGLIKTGFCDNINSLVAGNQSSPQLLDQVYGSGLMAVTSRYTRPANSLTIFCKFFAIGDDYRG